jgi:hypothetical protein
MTESLLLEVQEETKAERVALFVEYRDVLTRGDKADSARLRALMTALDRTPPQVQADLEALGAAAALEAELLGMADALDEAERADKADKAATAKLAIAQAKAADAQAARDAARDVVAALEAKVLDLYALQARNFALFGVAEPPAVEVPAHITALQAVPGHAATVAALGVMANAVKASNAAQPERDARGRAEKAAAEAAESAAAAAPGAYRRRLGYE